MEPQITKPVMWAGSPQAIWLGSDCSATAGSQAQLLLTKSAAFAQHLASFIAAPSGNPSPRQVPGGHNT